MTCIVAVWPVLSAAQSVMLRGRVVDTVSGAPLPEAHVQCVGSRIGAVADANGAFELAANGTPKRISHMGHAPVIIPESRWTEGDTVPLRIALQPVPLELRPVDIAARAEPEAVFQRNDLHVAGYLAAADGIWVLAYDKAQLWLRQSEAGAQRLQGARLHLLDSAFAERAASALPGTVVALHRDHAGRPIIECTARAYQATFAAGAIRLAPMDLDTMRAAVLPWTDSIPGLMLGNNRQSTFPAFAHFARRSGEAEEYLVCAVEDRHMMALLRSQYKYMSGHDKVVAMDLEKETGIDCEIIAGYMTGFPQHPLFKVPYAPLFAVGDTLCVFDHAAGRLRRFDRDGNAVGTAPLPHIEAPGWAKQLLQDPVDRTVYALFKRGPRAWLRAISPVDGALGPPIALAQPWPQEVQVSNGWIYSIHRPYGSTQRRTLYREPVH